MRFREFLGKDECRIIRDSDGRELADGDRRKTWRNFESHPSTSGARNKCDGSRHGYHNVGSMFGQESDGQETWIFSNTACVGTRHQTAGVNFERSRRVCVTFESRIRRKLQKKVTIERSSSNGMGQTG